MSPLSWDRVFIAWTPDAPALLLVVVLGVGYLAGTRRIGEWPRVRTLAFLAGLGTVVVVTCSFLGVYENTLFWPRAVQVVVLLMITPLLLALGAPLTLLLAAAPAPVSARLRGFGRCEVARKLTFPLVITAALILPPLLIYLTPLYELCLRHRAVDEVVRLALVWCGFGYFWTRLRIDPTPREDHHLVSFGMSFAEVLIDAVLGLILWLGPLRAADYYHAVARAWGPDMRTDQIIGAGVLWIGGDLAGLPFVGALFASWRRHDERQAVQIDAELDRQEACEPGSAKTSGLWWENDPVLAERFKRR